MRLGPAAVRFTGRAEGDLRTLSDPATLARARERIADMPWSWVRQVHGAEVAVVGAGGQARPVPEADALVTAEPGQVLAVRTADCGPVAIVAEGGDRPAVAAVHCGWRGVAGGVLDAAARELREVAGGTPRLSAVLGPCIEAACYEFAGPERDELAARLGPAVAATTSAGTPALDLRAAIALACTAAGVDLVHVDERCTACEAGGLWSHRARGDEERQAVAVWLVP